MTIEIKTKPGEKIIELGGGANPRFHPNVDVRACFDAQGNPTVDFTADFNTPLPIATDEWDGVYSSYCLEHVSYLNVMGFVREILRILKPGGKAVIITANTQAQLTWLQQHPEGWDNKDFFTASSELLFGSQDYSDNAHKCFFTPLVLEKLFRDAGFAQVEVIATGERNTDLLVQAVKSTHYNGQAAKSEVLSVSAPPVTPANVGRWFKQEPDGTLLEADSPEGPFRKKEEATPAPVQAQEPAQPQPEPVKLPPPEELFGKDYFNGGHKWGGYAQGAFGGAYQDFPCHWVTFRKIMEKKPESVLELGCARGYILKRLQDHGVRATGLEVSHHCYLTRVCDPIMERNLLQTPWPVSELDLCFSVATMEHVPEQFVPAVIREMARTCKRGLHGIDFGLHDDGFDKTHCTLRSKGWWQAQFAQHAPGWPVEILDKEELEDMNQFPQDIIRGDGKLKLNLGSFTTMYHQGWTNVDIHDLGPWAQANGYGFLRHDLKQGLPYGTGVVDLIHLSHVLEHFSYEEGLRLLRECRRVIRPDGAMRIAVPDASLLMGLYNGGAPTEYDERNEPTDFEPGLSRFDEINDGCANSPTAAGKLWALLHEGHASCYDVETLLHALDQSGWKGGVAGFRMVHMDRPSNYQIVRETMDMHVCVSLYMDCAPKLA